jgi:hypothetical protein
VPDAGRAVPRVLDAMMTAPYVWDARAAVAAAAERVHVSSGAPTEFAGYTAPDVFDAVPDAGKAVQLVLDAMMTAPYVWDARAAVGGPRNASASSASLEEFATP